jgi:hypothetical protein
MGLRGIGASKYILVPFKWKPGDGATYLSLYMIRDAIIYFEWLHQYATWQQAKVFTFNSTPVTMDATEGKHLYVIQLQQ